MTKTYQALPEPKEDRPVRDAERSSKFGPYHRNIVLPVGERDRWPEMLRIDTPDDEC